MKLLLDTHVLLWAAAGDDRLSRDALELLNDPSSRLLFSTASIWEVVIKSQLGRSDFIADPVKLRAALLRNGYEELPISTAHVLAVRGLPPIHRDPFDRLLIAQVQVEAATLLTADEMVARYPGVRRV